MKHKQLVITKLEYLENQIKTLRTQNSMGSNRMEIRDTEDKITETLSDITTLINSNYEE